MPALALFRSHASYFPTWHDPDAEINYVDAGRLTLLGVISTRLRGGSSHEIDSYRFDGNLATRDTRNPEQFDSFYQKRYSPIFSKFFSFFHYKLPCVNLLRVFLDFLLICECFLFRNEWILFFEYRVEYFPFLKKKSRRRIDEVFDTTPPVL